MAEQNLQSSKKRNMTIALLVIVIAIIIWQIMGIFSSNAPAPNPKKENIVSNTQTSQQTPKSANLITADGVKTTEQKMREAASARYLAAVDELQVLKVNKEIAETNRDIAKAGEETVAAQKNTLQNLSGIMPPSTASGYASNLNQSSPPSVQSQASAPPATHENYVVVSVSMLQGKWTAVLGNQGQLFNVSVGDVIPLDQTKVVSIDRGGVYLQDKSGKRNRISLVPII